MQELHGCHSKDDTPNQTKVVTSTEREKDKSKNRIASMLDSIDSTAFNFEQGQRARKLFAAVVLAALDDAIADDKKYGNGPDQIARWARSRDGREVVLTDARRLWYWAGAASLSELAVRGTSKPTECKFPVSVPRVLLLEAIEILDVTAKAQASIASVPVWTA